MRTAVPIVAVLAGALTLGVAAQGCDDGSPAEPPSQPEQDAGQDGAPPPDGGPTCDPGTMLQEDGSCLAAGVPPDGCADGFEPDGADGCQAILPSTPCTTPGQLAYLGETSCHDIAPCGTGAWGQIPTEPNTQHVDGSTTELGADGSAAKPWPTVQQGVDAAAPGAIVAVAEGHYLEEVVITAPMQLWGRCPTLVTLAGTSAPALTIHPGGSGTVVRGIAVTGDDHGVLVQGVTEVVLMQLWIHNIARHGIRAGKHESPTELAVREVLVDGLASACLVLFGVQASIEQVVTRGSADNQDSRGLEVQDDMDHGRRSQVSLRAGVLEDHGWANVYAIGSDLSIEASLIRDTAGPDQFGSTYGFGVLSHSREETGELPVVTISGAVIEGVHRVGVYFGGGIGTVENTVIVDPRPTSELIYGRGLVADADFYPPHEPAQVTVRGSLIHRATDTGVLAWDSDLTLERTIIRDTQPCADNQSFGVGMYARSDLSGPQPARATLVGSVIQGSHMAAAVALGAEITLDGVVLETTEVQLSDGTLGDGLVMINSYPNAADAELTNTLIRQNVRAGISSFGAGVRLSTSVLDCNPIHINGEITLMADFEFADLGGNWCGCAADEVLCQVLSSNIQMPVPVEDPGGL